MRKHAYRLGLSAAVFVACSDDGQLGANDGNGTSGSMQTDPSAGSANVTATSPADDDGTGRDPLDSTGSGGSIPTGTETEATTTDATSTGTATDPDPGSTSTTSDESTSTTGDAQSPYDPCAMTLPVCLDDEICLLTPMGNICTPVGCESVDDCPPPPPGGTAEVICQDGNGNGIDDCLLDCSNAAMCPPQMLCFNNQICVWPPS